MFQNLKSSAKKAFLGVMLGVASSMTFAAGTAAAATTSYVDVSVGPAIAQIGTDIGTIAGYVWPVLLLGTGIGIAMKLVKKFAHKA